MQLPAPAPARRPRRAWLLCLLPALVLLLASLGQAAFSPDSVYYWSAARSLLQGQGLRTAVPYDEARLRYGEPVVPSAQPSLSTPLCAWPPGYPLALALSSRLTGAPLSRAALGLNAAALLGVTLLLLRLAQGLCPPLTRSMAPVIALVLGAQPFLQGIARRLWSETLFLLFLLGGLLALQRAATRPQRRAALALAIVLAAAATYVRFTGFTLALTVVLTALRSREPLPLRGDQAPAPAEALPPRWRVGEAVLAGLGYALLLTPLLIYNHLRCDTLSGAARLPSDRDLLHNLADAARALIAALPLTRGAVAGSADVILSALLLLLLGARTALLLRHQPGPSLERAAARPLWLFTATYALALLALRTRTLFDPLSVRLLAPALVCAGLLVLCAVARVWRGRPPLTLLALALTLCASLSDGLRNAPGWHPLTSAERSAVAACLDPSETAAIYSDQPLAAHLLTGRPARWPPPEPQPRALLVLTPRSPYFPAPARQTAYEAAWRGQGALRRCQLPLLPLSEASAASLPRRP